MAVLRFGAAATIGALRYTSGIAAIRVTLSLGPGVGSARITLPRDLRVEAQPGDDATISLIGESGAESDVFTGLVAAVHHTLDHVTVVCGDASAALAAIRPGTTFERQGASAIISALSRDAGVRTGILDVDVDLVSYVAHQGRTAWEHVTTLAAWGGARVSTSADGRVEVWQSPSPPADLALRYGREIAEFSVSTTAPTGDVVLVGGGPAGNTSDPRAHLQSASTLPEDAPGPDAHTLRIAAPALRVPAAASRASRTLSLHNGVPRLRAACWMVPQLRAGTTVEIADAPPAGAAGPWLITRVAHQVGPGPAGRSSFEAIDLARTGGSGLLGQLGSTVGSLL